VRWNRSQLIDRQRAPIGTQKDLHQCPLEPDQVLHERLAFEDRRIFDELSKMPGGFGN
jgi:hypothetical protein